MFLYGFVLGIIFLISIQYLRVNKKKRKENLIDILKNALLSYALGRLREKDFDGLNFSYETFDGRKLPGMSGFDETNACMSYIIDISDFHKGPWYSRPMEQKIVAINKYLDKNFDTDQKIEDFFEEFVKSCRQSDATK